MDGAYEKERLILLTGASGYVGGRVLKALEPSGCRVRCLVRKPESIKEAGSSKTSFHYGDVLKSDLRDVLEGVETAYYLIHSMDSAGSFEEEDRQAARNFGEAARRAGVRRIIYLGGLGESNDSLSPHLKSRHEAGEILRESGVQVIEFRASIVIGSGSLSFEMMRSLVERLPVMITPRWVSVSAQPISIDDLIQYLLAALDLPVEGNRIFEIGGSDVVSYGDIMKEYARQRGLRRLRISVPVLTPRLSSLWLSLVTPLQAKIGRKLIDSIRHPTIVRDGSAAETFSIRPKGLREAIESALGTEDREIVEMKWSEVLSSTDLRRDWRNVRIGSRLVDSRITKVDLLPAAAFNPIRRIGGSSGWYYGNWLWRLRGFLDEIAGGVGFRRGRSDQDKLKVGDTVDFWRVEAIEPDRRLRLAAEMNLPGRAWLEFEIESGSSSSTIRQTAVFDPVGLCGLLYWYALYPLHELVFSGMLRGIADAAVRLEKRA